MPTKTANTGLFTLFRFPNKFTSRIAIRRHPVTYIAVLMAWGYAILLGF